ncbi:hypothetical protein [Bradyrhizobium betae]|uniref:hypothetical protein n=1 Tax=Bradyrhizobium betae TaxID=244734 RepID=UPI001913588A|nr:hypothetical protein [Bradyrhizobium betae]MCS3726513.1 hypothetical protein [Bradyrhizobium betae]
MLVERIALEHAQAASAGADWRRVEILIDRALGERDGLGSPLAISSRSRLWHQRLNTDQKSMECWSPQIGTVRRAAARVKTIASM